METEGVRLSFTDDAIERIAHFAAQANEQVENIGARRLHTILETLLEELSFTAPEQKNQEVEISAQMVEEKLASILESEDLSRFVL